MLGGDGWRMKKGGDCIIYFLLSLINRNNNNDNDNNRKCNKEEMEKLTLFWRLSHHVEVGSPVFLSLSFCLLPILL